VARGGMGKEIESEEDTKGKLTYDDDRVAMLV
jgi:hypothetical protein